MREPIRRVESIAGESKAVGRAFREPAGSMGAEAGPPIVLRPFEARDMTAFERWLSAPHVKRWYGDPEDWLREAEDYDGKYSFIRRFIAELDGAPVGFCQYYKYRLGGESWHGRADTEGAYSIDYLIGEPERLGRGLGRQTAAALIEKIRLEDGAKRIIVRPEEENLSSRGVLRSCGFRFDEENRIYIYDLIDNAGKRSEGTSHTDR